MEELAFNVNQEQNPLCSTFEKGYINKEGKAVPQSKPRPRPATLYSIYRYITGHYAKEATRRLRTITDEKEAKQFKVLNFMAFTPSGIFKYRRANSLAVYSQLMVIDIDNVTSQKRLYDIRQQLLDDKFIETELLFISPSGYGLKWVIYLGDVGSDDHRNNFRIIADYLFRTYGIEVDESGKDVCRLCFLPYDPECFINQELKPDSINK